MLDLSIMKDKQEMCSFFSDQLVKWPSYSVKVFWLLSTIYRKARVESEDIDISSLW